MKIYAIMTMSNLEKDPMTRMPKFGATSVPGFFTDRRKAFDVLTGNCYDLFEFNPRFALIEEVDEGLYGITKNRWWFEFDYKHGCYKEIDEPDFMEKFGGFTIG